jgi:AhpD family alkylhydroperoxidase
MKKRIDYQTIAPKSLNGMYEIEEYVDRSELENTLVELVKLRVSQINGCAYSIDVHTKKAREGGETEQRLYSLSVWEKTPYYTDRERAALKWAESLTNIAHNAVPDELYEYVRRYFAETELTALTMAIIAVNGWNRLAISFRNIPGSYRPELAK